MSTEKFDKIDAAWNFACKIIEKLPNVENLHEIEKTDVMSTRVVRITKACTLVCAKSSNDANY